jgi:hypothetical protein
MTPHDNTPRIVKIGDALSQLNNVTWFRNHADTDANESISGRSHRMGWRLEWWIDLPFTLFGRPNHCRDAVLKDLERARRTIARHGGAP